MIESIAIKNFRCFEDLNLDGLGLVNVIVGDNSAGKTALLEAVFLSQGTAASVLPMRSWRGLSGAEIRLDRVGYESIWRDLFYKNAQSLAIDINANGSPENTRHVEIFYDSSEPVMVELQPSGKSSVAPEEDSSLIRPLRFYVTDGNGERIDYSPYVGTQGLMVRPATRATAAFSFASYVSAQDAAREFSELKNIRGARKKFKDTIRKVFPAVSNITVESYSGTWMLHCNVPGIREKLPLGLVSGGVQKLIGLLLGIATRKDTVLLVDEVENGIYFKALPEMWRAIYSFAKEFNTQLFVSTHSRECLQSLAPTIKAANEPFRLIRVENLRGRRIARIFAGKNLRSAIETETEVR